MRWEDERYVRVYTRDTPEWIGIGWEARSVFYELCRKVDRTGFMPMGRTGYRGVSGLLHIPVDIITAGMEALIEDGCVHRVADGILIPNFLEAQEARQSDAMRKRQQRQRDRDSRNVPLSLDSATPNVTQRDSSSDERPRSHVESRAVQSSHAASPQVTSSHPVPCCTVPCLTKPTNAEAPQAGSVGSVEELPEPRPDAGPPSPAGAPFGLPTPETPSAPRRGRRKGAQAMLPGFVAEPADDVFAAYVDAWKRKVGGGAVPLLSEDRRKLVRARLAEGHTVDTLKGAAAGIFLSEWHYMNRKDGRCSFDLALRDTENVEKFAGLSEAAKPKPKRPEWLDEGTQLSPRMKAAWKEQLRTGIKPDTSGFSLETFLEGNGVDHMLEGLE